MKSPGSSGSWLLGSVIACLLVCGIDGARADTKSDAAAAYAEGQKKYALEDYDGAAKLFLDAYNLDPDPAYLFNIAQAYRFGKQCESASTYYKKFLDVVPEAPNAVAVRGYIQEVDACAREQAAARQPPPPPPPQLQPEPVQPMPVAPTPRGGSAVRSVAFGMVGLAIIGGVGGVLWQRQVSYWESEREELCATKPCEWDGVKGMREDYVEKKGKRDAALSIASFTVSGAAVVAAAVLFIVDGGTRDSEHAMTIVPTSNGALVHWSF